MDEQNNEIKNWVPADMLEVTLNEPDDFLKIGETLTRIGVASRKDNKLLHTEIVNPLLHLLSNSILKNVDDEFLNALNHYKNSRNKECVNDCLKALETTLKIICHHNNWTFDTTKDTANKLINICTDNGLIPSYLLSHFSALRTTIEAGVPTVRNKTSGHGQGVNPITVPDHLASYVVYMTGTTIKFLVDCQNQIKPF